MKREAEAQRMRDGGMSYAAIGQIHGVSGETIRRWLNPAVRNRHNIANVLYRSAHKEEKRASAVAYYAAHKEKIAAYSAIYRATHKEKITAYRVEHRKEFRAYQAIYRARHRKEINAAAVVYRETHREEAMIYERAWAKKHPDKVNAYHAARRAMILGATVGNLAEIAEIYRQAKEAPTVRCYLCGNLIPMGHRHVDHICPLSKGGLHRPSNLAVSCDQCNLHKHNKLPSEVGILI